jgi:signal transduction histidine kinase
VSEALQDRSVPVGPARAIYALPIPNPTGAGAALAFRIERGRGRRARELAGEALPALAWLLERDHVLEIGEETQQTPAEALLREASIACELHDNSLQDVAALATELRYFRQQLVQALLPSDGDPRLLGRVDDIEARVRHLDAGLRVVARDGGLPIAPAQSLREGLEQVIEDFDAAGSIQLDFNFPDTEELVGPPDRIVAVRIVQEALRNVARHSGADKACVQVAAAASGLKIEVWDNGRGFDVSKVRRRAIQNGRLGLRSMEQRAQLLGGTLELFSSGRGHTRVILTLPAGERRVAAADQPTVAHD